MQLTLATTTCNYHMQLPHATATQENDHASQRRKIEANHEELVGEFKRTMQVCGGGWLVWVLQVLHVRARRTAGRE
jgi:hypothetical protein